jgi:golgi apparatus protein 1
MAKDTIKNHKHSLPKACREQVRSQLYQQRESIDFDPKLKSTCRDDIKNLCNDILPQSGQVSS